MSRIIRSSKIIALTVSLSGMAELATAQPNDDDTIRELVGRLELSNYKETIRGLTQFGDRRQGTARNRAAVDWIEEQLESYGCPTARVDYIFDPDPRPPRTRRVPINEPGGPHGHRSQARSDAGEAKGVAHRAFQPYWPFDY